MAWSYGKVIGLTLLHTLDSRLTSISIKSHTFGRRVAEHTAPTDVQLRVTGSALEPILRYCIEATC
jgi:hypothetical protein